MKKLLLAEIDKLETSINKTTDFFYMQHTDEGISSLKSTIELLIRTNSFLNNYQINNQCIVININEMNQFFNEIIKAIENKDYVLVSDIFQYEILTRMIDAKVKLLNIEGIE